MSLAPAANPLDSTFHILKGLHEEIQELRGMVAQERHARSVDVNNLSDQLEALRANKSERFERMTRQVEELQRTRDQHRAATEASISKIAQSCDAQHARLEAAAEAGARRWKDEAGELRQRIATESQQLLERCKALEKKTREERRLSEIAGGNARERHESLRSAVERIEAVLCDNHMARDPFRHFGERPSTGATVGGSEKVSGSRSSTHCGTRPPTSASTVTAATPTFKRNTNSHGFSPECTTLPDVAAGGAS
mmetsp:Transcript_96204/g.272372  ORF Transcript_96204/g.272372 Transcript_96204/m.272372 type:complete len:253 (+) Transcript_96204:228-986(+)